MKLDASFYHHGDHHLCLGVYLSHLEHIDPHPMGYHNCRDALGIDNTYIPLTVDDKGDRALLTGHSVKMGCSQPAQQRNQTKLKFPIS